MQRGFDTFSSTTAYHSPPLPPPSPPPQASHSSAPGGTGCRGRELPSADRIVQHAGWAGKRRALRSCRALRSSVKLPPPRLHPRMRCARLGCLPTGWHSRRARAARWALS